MGYLLTYTNKINAIVITNFSLYIPASLLVVEFSAPCIVFIIIKLNLKTTHYFYYTMSLL